MKIIAVPTTPTSVFDLLGEQQTKPVNMQAAKANVGDVLFGDKNQQPFFLPPSGSVEIPAVNTRNVFIVGTGGDFIALGIF